MVVEKELLLSHAAKHLGSLLPQFLKEDLLNYSVVYSGQAWLFQADKKELQASQAAAKADKYCNSAMAKIARNLNFA